MKSKFKNNNDLEHFKAKPKENQTVSMKKLHQIF